MGRHEGAFAVASGAAAPVCEKQAIVDFLTGYSVETSPAAADKLDSFRDHLAAGTRVYVATLARHRIRSRDRDRAAPA